MIPPTLGLEKTPKRPLRRAFLRQHAREDALHRNPAAPPVVEMDRIARLLLKGPPLSRRQRLTWLLSWTQSAGLSRSMRRLFVNEVELSTQIHRRNAARTAYRQALKVLQRSDPSSPQPSRGWWSDDPTCTPETLHTALVEAITDSSPIKETTHTAVYWVSLFGRSACVKVFHPRPWKHRIRHRKHPSPAHHSWAVSRTLEQLHLSCPRPLGWLEMLVPAGGTRSWFISEWLDETQDASRYMKRDLHRLPASQRSVLAREIRDKIFTLYDHGCYHADTKTGNMLLQHPEDDARRHWYWIDLDVLSVDARITLRRQVRNLVQLNGSIDRHIDREERLAYLRLFAQRSPRLSRHRIARHIETRTRERLAHELASRCGA